MKPEQISPARIEVGERHDRPGVWSVEAIGGDGEIYQAWFMGPDARGRAYEYARLKYDVSDAEPQRQSP